jgi:hypothetical protein
MPTYKTPQKRTIDGKLYSWIATEYSQQDATNFLKNQYSDGKGGIAVNYRISPMRKTKSGRPARFDIFVDLSTAKK